MSTPVLTLTRGLPGSGKTTWALSLTATLPNTVRVNRDDLRAMLRMGWPHGDRVWEQRCSTVQYHTISALLGMGLHVICDDTNLNPNTVATLTYLATCCGASVRIEDFTDVPINVCIARDATRPNPVGAAVIERMWAAYQTAIQHTTDAAGGGR